MKDKRQTSSTSKAAGSSSASSEAPARKGGGVIGGLALIIALGASAVSAYLYTELQKFRSQTSNLVESSTSELKSGVQTDLESVKSEITGLDSQFSTSLSELSSKLDNSLSGMGSDFEAKLGGLGSDLENKLSGLDTDLKSRLDTVSGKVDTTSTDLGSQLTALGQQLDERRQAAFTELADNTAAAVQELTSKTESEITSLATSVTGKMEEQNLALQESTGARFSELEQSVTEQFGQVSDRFGQVDESLSILSQELIETRQLATKGQREWILAETEYLLRTGGHRVNLAGDTKSAVLALRSASERLYDLGDSRYSPVREQIAEEVAELRQVGTPDIEGIAYELEKLSKRADTLPLPPTGVEQAVAQVREEPTEANARAVADQLFQSLKQLVRVEQSDGTPLVRPGKPTRQQLTASEALRLNLQAARLSALRRDQGTYIIHMESAENYVRDVYYQEDEITKAYLEDLAVMKVQKIVPSVSKLGQALIMFNEIHSKRGEN